MDVWYDKVQWYIRQTQHKKTTTRNIHKSHKKKFSFECGCVLPRFSQQFFSVLGIMHLEICIILSHSTHLKIRSNVHCFHFWTKYYKPPISINLLKLLGQPFQCAVKKKKKLFHSRECSLVKKKILRWASNSRPYQNWSILDQEFNALVSWATADR